MFLFLGRPAMVELYAQSFASDVIGSSGTFVTSPYGSMAWTIGEVTIETYSSDENYFTQGFHQPDIRLAEVTDFFIPEGFSPNGDMINDLFVIRGILRYPKNTFMVFNRWGNKLFEASPYENTWDGKAYQGGVIVGGDELPVGTYFYILNLNDGTPVYKGTIYLNR